MWLMALLTLLSGAGLAYSAVLLENFAYGKALLITKLLSEVGLAGLISVVAFVGLLIAYRMELNRLREECRRLFTTLLESRLGKPGPTSLTGVVQEQKLIVNHNNVVPSASRF